MFTSDERNVPVIPSVDATEKHVLTPETDNVALLINNEN